MVGKGPEHPDPPTSATGRGGSIIPAQPLWRALLDSMQTTAAGVSSSTGRGRGRTKKPVRGGRGSGRGRKAVTPSSPPPSADSPDHRSAPSDVDPSRTPVHEPPVADPSPDQTRVADPLPHMSPVPESSSQKTPVTGSSSQKTPVMGFFPRRLRSRSLLPTRLRRLVARRMVARTPFQMIATATTSWLRRARRSTSVVVQSSHPCRRPLTRGG